MKKFIIVIFLWLCWGFSLGTLLLLGPLRWVVNYQRQKPGAENSERIIVIILMIILGIVSFLIAFSSAKMLTKHNVSRTKKIAVWAIPLIAAIVAVYIFFHPDWINTKTMNKVETVNTSFSTGPYPELDKMNQLKEMGYTAVVSLLHPAVIPFEPALLEKERKNAEEAELEFIHIPFLPWISDNENSIDSLRKLARNATGKYYVHCYLGVDRISAAAGIIRGEGKAMDFDVKESETRLLSKKFERGEVTLLEKDVYLGPQLSKEEYFYVVSGIQQVVSLSNLKDPEAKVHTVEEEKWLKPFRISFKVFDVNENTSESKMRAVVEETKKLQKPLFIHGFFTDAKEIILFRTLYMKSQK